MTNPADDRRIRFNKTTLLALQPPEKGRVYYHDTATPSLKLCITSAGTMTFYHFRKHQGQTQRLKLGTFPDELTVDKARKKAAEATAEYIAGGNPHQERKKRRQQSQAEMNLGELFAWWLEHHANPHKKASSVAEDERLFLRYLEPWKTRRLSSIARSDVRSLHAKIGKENGKTAANRMLSLLGSIFQKAIEADDVDFENANPARGIKRFPEEERERFLQADELQRFFEALEEQTPIMRDYFKIALLTGARRGNVQAMRWDELNLDRGEWMAPDTKGNKPQTIYLPAVAVEVLRERRQENEAKESADRSDYVFPSRRGSSKPHVTYQYRAWARICEAAGLENIRPHDLRRSLGSWQAATGAGLPVIGKTLGHRNQSTTAIYARLNLDPVRVSVDLAVNAMLQAANPEGGNGIADGDESQKPAEDEDD